MYLPLGVRHFHFLKNKQDTGAFKIHTEQCQGTLNSEAHRALKLYEVLKEIDLETKGP